MDNVVIKAKHLSKVYKIYEKNIDRLKETFHPFHKRYSKDFYALQDVSFEIKRGENVGLVGKNGAGKSTLLKLITGVLTPTSGTLEVNGKIASLLELGAGFNPDMTGVENVYMNGLLMGHSRADMDKKLADIVAFADIGEFINQPVKTYSSGMFARLAFAVNAFVEPDILIIDEALSVGDTFFQSKCMDKMRSMIDSGVTVLFVSHDTYAVKNLCQRAFYIKAGKLVMDSTAQDVVEFYSSEIVKMRRELVGGDDDYRRLLIDAAKREQMKVIDDTPDFNIPLDVESLSRGRETFLKNAEYQRLQDGRVDFLNVQLMNLDGDLISEVVFGQEVILRMVIKFNQTVDCLGFGYHIRNSTGVDLVYTDSRFNKTKAIYDGQPNEVYVLDWKFKVELREELYTIACVISTPIDEKFVTSNMCDYVPCAVQFNVVSPDVYSMLVGGYVHWHNDLKVSKISDKVAESTTATKKICACCGNEVEEYLPLPEIFFKMAEKYDVDLYSFNIEMLNIDEYLCPHCDSADRERAYALTMKRLLNPRKKIRILEIAPRKCIGDFIKKNFPLAEHKTGDLLMSDVDYKLDVTDMNQIETSSFDFFICSHVLEHVDDDLKAMRELKRILTPEGCGILVVPIDLDRKEIDEDPNCTDVDERWRRFGQDDHVRAYSKAGYLQRLKQAGFEVKEYGKNFFGEKAMYENRLTATSVVYVVYPE